MCTEDVSLKPDNREFIAENTGLMLLFSFSLIAMPLLTIWHIRYVNVLVGLFSLFIAGMLVIRYITLNSVVWIVREDTICRIQGVLSRQTDYIELYRVVDYQESQTFFQKILNVKTVTVLSTDKSDAIMEMYGVNYTLDLVSVIRQRVEKCKKEKRIYEIANR